MASSSRAEVGVEPSQEDPGADVLRDQLELPLEHADHTLLELARSLVLAESTESIRVGDVRVVVVPIRLERPIYEGGGILESVGSEHRATQNVVGALAVGLALDGGSRELDRLVVLLLGVAHARSGGQHLGRLGIQRHGTVARRDATLDPFDVLLFQLVDHAAHVGNACVRERELRIQLDRLLEHLERKIQILAPRVAAAAQVVVVGLQILGRLALDRSLLLWCERDAQGLRDAPRNLVLNGEHVFHLAVVPLSPRRMPALRLYQLRRDAESAPGPTDAALEDVGRPELLADLGGRQRLVAKREDLGTREHADLPDLGQLCDDVLGHSIAKVLVILGAAQVFEVEDRH